MSGNLKTIMGYVSNVFRTMKAAIFLDNGSTVSLITENLANRLKLPCHQTHSLSTTHFESFDRNTKQFICSLTPKIICEDVRIKVIVVPTFCTRRENARLNVTIKLNSLLLVDVLIMGVDLLIPSYV